MRRGTGRIFYMAMAVIFFVGCSNVDKDTGTPRPVTGGAVEEEASGSVAVQKESEPLVRRKSRYANADNMYQMGQKNGTLQRCSLDGTVLQTLQLDMYEIS